MCGNVEMWKCGFPLIVPLWLKNVEMWISTNRALAAKKCGIVKISPHSPSVFPLPVEFYIFLPNSAKNLLSPFAFLRFFSYLCTKFGMFPLDHRKEQAI